MFESGNVFFIKEYKQSPFAKQIKNNKVSSLEEKRKMEKSVFKK